MISEIIQQVWLTELTDSAISTRSDTHDGVLHGLTVTHHTYNQQQATRVQCYSPSWLRVDYISLATYEQVLCRRVLPSGSSHTPTGHYCALTAVPSAYLISLRVPFQI